MKCSYCNNEIDNKCLFCSENSIKPTETATMVEHSEMVVPKELTRKMREQS